MLQINISLTLFDQPYDRLNLIKSMVVKLGEHLSPYFVVELSVLLIF